MRNLSRSPRVLVPLLLLFAGEFSTRAYGVEREEDENARLQRFKDLYDSASRSYGSGNYTAAIPSLQTAYALRPLPPLLFNIGQAYRKLELWTEARVYLELYRSVHLDMPRDRATLLDELVLEAREKERLAHTPQVIEKTRLLYVAQEKPLPKWFRPFGVVTGALGLGAIGVGGWMLGIHGTCTHDPVSPALACEQVYSTRTPGIGVLAAGGAALLVGTVTFALSFRKPAKPVVQQTPATLDSLPSLEQSALAPRNLEAETTHNGAWEKPRPLLMVPSGSAKEEPPPTGVSAPGPAQPQQHLQTLEVPRSPRHHEPPPSGWGARARSSHH